MLNRTNQCRDIIETSAANLFLRQLSEPPLHHVQPRAGCRREMKMKARMPAEPRLNARVLVSTVIVYDEVELQIGRCLAVDLLEKSNKLLVSMPRHAVPYDFSI